MIITSCLPKHPPSQKKGERDFEPFITMDLIEFNIM
jgi:hypothetical protein